MGGKGHTSLRVMETVLTEVILYRRRAMHKDEAGMPTPAPIKNFVAEGMFRATARHR